MKKVRQFKKEISGSSLTRAKEQLLKLHRKKEAFASPVA
jgi:hypothetical protein